MFKIQHSCGHLHKSKPVKDYNMGRERGLTKDPGQHHYGGSHNQTPMRVCSNHDDEDDRRTPKAPPLAEDL